LYRERPYTDMKEMLENDEIASAFGIVLEGCEDGRCTLTMKIKRGMCNAYGAVHGAVIYALADCAFAVAGNSRGEKAVGLSVTINYRRPVENGESLKAEAFEESRGKTTAVYRMRVTNQDGKLIAVADGLAYLSK